MAANFSIQPVGRFAGPSQPVKRPKEFACFSYDENHEFRLDDSSLKWYYTPRMGADLSKGFEKFQKQDDSQDEHLDSLLKAIMAHEQETGTKIDANFVTWRGMMTKILAALFEQNDGFIEENHAYKMAMRKNEAHRPRRGGPPPEVMQFWGYKFETLSTMPATWDETSRDFIEGRENHVVNNKAQYCSIVRTGIGKAILCLGGEVDAIWDSKPEEKGAPINWVELKTSAEIRSHGDMDAFHRKLMKYWIQSFLLGVPKIIVGFRTRDGILVDLNEIETHRIPETVNSRPNARWNADMCVNFASAFLEWLSKMIKDEGVWRIARRQHSSVIELYRVEATGHGNILPEEFKNWRIKLALGPDPEGTRAPSPNRQET
ncbi:RAI1 like PD-(D/E)XK nuclease domain-containing protein [Hirsutella rhossiliensis]|uniref:Decapping nuclease n=1 Tax=Hirsutella rhossiliensis TaxID=111463 RepID=A0A9P8N1G5_9HYPO|nr:RAI1 like PD-(D/E)XK nuclease domain-containing protein [Hirsutella rhossiliensis]KAH0965109.1 RAI1 like PD-(D/E)XK nuclease domain-containing protein [Hirsutella rhossiliensis]